jgi:hypothetical protein
VDTLSDPSKPRQLAHSAGQMFRREMGICEDHRK